MAADASGPLSFMDVWDAMCRTIMSAGNRRGAMMATMRCDHPDVEAFIDAKRDPARLRMFNLSVLITDTLERAASEITKAMAMQDAGYHIDLSALRADLPTTLAAAMRLPEIKALVGAAKKMAEGVVVECDFAKNHSPDFFRRYEAMRAALAAITGAK